MRLFILRVRLLVLRVRLLVLRDRLLVLCDRLLVLRERLLVLRDLLFDLRDRLLDLERFFSMGGVKKSLTCCKRGLRTLRAEAAAMYLRRRDLYAVAVKGCAAAGAMCLPCDRRLRVLRDRLRDL